MPENKVDQQQQQPQPEAPASELFESPEGGKYVVNNQTVNAEGEPIKGKLSNENVAGVQETNAPEAKNKKG